MAKGYIQLPPAHARIDWSHPITRGLVCAWTANTSYGVEAGGSGILVTFGRGQRIGNYAGTIARKADYVETTGAGCCIEIANTVNSAEFSLVANMQVDTGGFDTAIGRILEATNFGVQCGNASGIQLRKYTSSSTCNVDWDAAGISATEWKTFGVSSPDSITATDHICYVDGAVIAQSLSTNGTGTPLTTIGTLNLFNRTGATKNRSFDGRMRFAYFWIRALTPGEQKLLANDPFCFWTWEGKPTPTYSDVRIGTKTSNFTTFANATRSSGAINLEWANMSNAQTSNDTRATVTTINPPPASPYSGNTHYLKATQLASPIHASAIPLGVKLTIERRATGSGVATTKDSQVYIVKGGTVQTTENKADTGTSYPLSDTTKTYGGTNDLWSQTWTASDINDAGFGMVLSVNLAQDMEDAALPEIDQIFAELTYIGEDSTTHEGAGTANITATTSGAGTLILLGAASPSMTFTTSGAGTLSAAGAGSASITATTSGTPFLTLQGAATPLISISGLFQTVEFGAGSSTITFTGSATGSIPIFGAGTSSFTFTGTGAGTVTAKASASVNVILSSAASGFRTTFGAATPSITVSSSGSGLKTLLGAPTAQIDISTAASGSRTTFGAGTPSISFAATATPLRNIYAYGTPTISFSTSASGLKTLLGTATGIVAFTANTNTKLTANATASADVVFTSTAQALKTLLATASADITLSALAVIAGTILGTGSANISATASASGLKTLYGGATPTIALTSSGSGLRTLLGTTSATITTTSATSAQLVLLGASSAQITLAAQALIDSGFVISFVDEFTMNIEWEESRRASINPVADFTIPITPTKSIRGR